MKTRRFVISFLLFAMVLMTFHISAFADLTKAEALGIARQAVPSGCKVTEVSYDKKDKDWECEFLTKNKKIEYEIKVDGVTGKITKKEMEKQCDKGGCCVRISKKRARNAVAKLFRDAVITKVWKCKDDGFYIYRVLFHGDGYRCNAEVNASTGVVNEWTKYF